MSIDFSDITVVLQGPIYRENGIEKDRIMTKDCVASVRNTLPGSKILLSTWLGEDVSELDVDEVLFNEDPGSTVIKYCRNNQPHRVNVNRQVVSTVNGLQSVKTKYAIKLRTDNILYKSDFVSLLHKFPNAEKQYCFTENKVIVANIFGKEFVRGLYAPFLFSDFFFFGLKEDLLKIWDVPFIEEYQFNPLLKGKRQHTNYPKLQLHVEQYLVLAFINKYISVDMLDKYDVSEGKKDISEKVLASNFIVLERERLGLQVPKRLQQNDGFPYEYYTFLRWQSLYKKYCDAKYSFPGQKIYNILNCFSRVLMYFTTGWKQHFRSRLTR